MSQVQNLITEHLDTWTQAIESKSSVGRGSSNKLNLIGIKKLRELILEMAVRGLLVPQDSNDEPASVLLEKIAAEKSQLIKDGKIKKTKPLPAITDEEKSFELPNGWGWIRLADAGYNLGQKIPDSEFSYIDVGAINKEKGIIETPTTLSPEDAPSRARKVVAEGTVIYSTVRPYLLNIAVVDKQLSPEPIASTAFAIIHPFSDLLAGYIYRYLRSSTFINYVESCQTGIAYPAINDKQFFNGVMPVPPSEEQKRIVAKVNELMALCDQLEQQTLGSIEAHQTLVEVLLNELVNPNNSANIHQAWSLIAENFDVLFTTEKSIDTVKQTILQLAVMGKLVPQNPNDEPASKLLEKVAAEKLQLIKDRKIKKTKPFPEVEDDEKPFDLPSGWEWVNLHQIIGVMDAGWSPACPPEPSPNNETWGVLKTTAVQKLKFLPFENKVLSPSKEPKPQYEVKVGDILFTRAGPLNRVGVSCLVKQTRPKLMTSDKIIRFHLVDVGMSEEYIVLCLQAGYTAEYLESSKSGMASSQVNISQDKLKMAPIPLPAKEEQQRIITKVVELMALCDQLKTNLKSAQTTQCQIAESIVQETLA
jgi:type I restriction enzyme S subunit